MIKPCAALAVIAIFAGCSKDEQSSIRFTGDFCELAPRQESFAHGKETIVGELNDDDVLVAVNGYPLTKKVFDDLTVMKVKQLSSRKDSNAAYLNNHVADFQKNYIPMFVNQRVLMDRAWELKLFSREEMENRVNEIVKHQSAARKMSVEQFVKAFPGDFKYYLYEVQARLLMERLVKTHIPPVGEVTDELVEAFQKSIDEDNAATVKTNEMKKAQLAAWKSDIIANRATFEELAQKYNEDEFADADSPGFWGEFERGEIDDKLVQSAVFSLKVGDISDPVEDDDGYHLIKVVSVTPPERNEKGRVIQDEIRKVMHIYLKKQPLLIRDANDILKADLKRQMQLQAVNRYLDDLKTNGVTRIEFPHGQKLFE